MHLVGIHLRHMDLSSVQRVDSRQRVGSCCSAVVVGILLVCIPSGLQAADSLGLQAGLESARQMQQEHKVKMCWRVHMEKMWQLELVLQQLARRTAVQHAGHAERLASSIVSAVLQL